MRGRDFIGASGTDFVQISFERPPFLLENFLPSGGTGIIFGKRGHGKTQLQLTLCRAFCSGLPFLSVFPPVSARCAYVSLDMTPDTFQERLRLIPDFGEWGDNFWAEASTRGPINIMESLPKHDWVARINEFAPDLIVFDTLHKIHDLDENAAATPAQVFGRLRYLFGGHPALMLNHHEGKDSPNPKFRRTLTEEKARGSGAWMDDSDCGIYIRKKKTIKGVKLEISFPRYRFSEEPLPISAEFGEGLLVEPIKGAGSCRDLARTLLHEHEPATKSELARLMREEGTYSKTQIYDVVGELWNE